MMLIRDEIGLPYAEERIKFLNLNLPPDGLYCVYILGVRNYLSKFSVMSEKDKQLTSFKAISISEEVVNELCAGYVFESRQDEFAVLLSLKDDYETELLRIADGIISRLQNELKLSVVIGISRAERGVENLKSLYAGARNAIKSAMLDAGKRIAIDRFGGNSEGSRRIYLKDQQKLADSLLAGNNEGAERALNHIFKETAKYEKGLARNCLFYIVASLMQSMSELQNSSESVLPDAKSVCERFFSLEKVEDMQSYLLSLCLDCCDSLNSMNKSQPKGIIRQAKKIIEEKYAENLSVNDIAKEVFLTNTYLCFLFKQETGMTINEYLIDVRIRAAKAMLDNANNKIYDVAFAVGYKSVSYFTRLFAKTTGITPSEYRGKVSFRKE
jgi:two-component system response regulator YesN